MGKKVEPGQRALWTFLLGTLVAPFLAALIIFIGSVGAGLIGRGGPDSLLALDRAGQLAWAADKAFATYVWSALPAGLGAAALAALAYTRGGFSVLAAAVAGAVPVSLLAFASGGMVLKHLTPIAFIGASVGVLIRLILLRARIIDQQASQK